MFKDLLKGLPHHKQTLLALCGLAALWISACAPTTPLPASPTPTATVQPPALVQEATAETLPEWIALERDASIQGNLPLLAALWAEDGRVVDGRGTENAADDYVWQGRAAILDRYQLAVFPAPPPPFTPDELANATLGVEGESATLVNGGDRWRFTRRDGRWWLQELVYRAP